MQNKLKIEVWSDVMCPFCYIGKRLFEQALEQFPEKENVELEWKAFQLNPHIPEDTNNENIIDYFAKEKGVSVQKSKELHQRIDEMAKSVGLDYHIDEIVVANSFNAHRLSYLAKEKSVDIQNNVEEALFKAYFTEGKNINDKKELLTIGEVAGIDKAEVAATLGNDEVHSYNVKQDIQEAANIGVSGVPFFLFDRKYAVSGAQPSEVFLGALKKSYEEWRSNDRGIEIIKGDTCSIDGECE